MRFAPLLTFALLTACQQGPGTPDPAATTGPGRVAAQAVGSPPSATGLSGTYYADLNFTGTTNTRVDAPLNFDWQRTEPFANFGDSWSARWEGFLQAPATGAYTLAVTSDDGVRLWVNGAKVIDDWTSHAAKEIRANVNLTAGARVPVKLEYFDGGGNASLKLEWIRPGGVREPIPASALSSGAPSDDEAARRRYEAAVLIWQNDDPAARPKGACASCHGTPDPLDLAYIGTPAATLIRRALVDGATPAEADALVQAVQDLRARYDIPQRDHLTFRPFQPGGSVLPGATSAERDLAFLKQIEARLPTLFGPRIDTLAKANAAAREVLDLTEGKNLGGKNPQRLGLRDLKVGFAYPRWSADLFNGAEHGTTNDWIADVAREAIPEKASEWKALRAAYLANPSNENFWRMYGAVKTLTRPRGFAANSDPGQWSYVKFHGALIGQHLMRQEVLGQGDFERGGAAYAYLDTAPYGPAVLANAGRMLPSKQLWDVAERARAMQSGGLARDNLAARGFPDFVVQSVPADLQNFALSEQVRLAWFDIGFRRQPDQYRLGGTNSTISGEYYAQSLHRQDLDAHAVFSSIVRRVSYLLPESRFPTPVGVYAMQNYYGQAIPSFSGAPAAPGSRAALLERLVANYHRMSLLLYLDGLPKGARPLAAAEFDGLVKLMRSAFARQPEFAAADAALIDAVYAGLGLPPS